MSLNRRLLITNVIMFTSYSYVWDKLQISKYLQIFLMSSTVRVQLAIAITLKFSFDKRQVWVSISRHLIWEWASKLCNDFMFIMHYNVLFIKHYNLFITMQLFVLINAVWFVLCNALFVLIFLYQPFTFFFQFITQAIVLLWS